MLRALRHEKNATSGFEGSAGISFLFSTPQPTTSKEFNPQSVDDFLPLQFSEHNNFSSSTKSHCTQSILIVLSVLLVNEKVYNLILSTPLTFADGRATTETTNLENFPYQKFHYPSRRCDGLIFCCGCGYLHSKVNPIIAVISKC